MATNATSADSTPVNTPTSISTWRSSSVDRPPVETTEKHSRRTWFPSRGTAIPPITSGFIGYAHPSGMTQVGRSLHCCGRPAAESIRDRRASIMLGGLSRYAPLPPSHLPPCPFGGVVGALVRRIMRGDAATPDSEGKPWRRLNPRPSDTGAAPNSRATFHAADRPNPDSFGSMNAQ
jgi:hypothetical protein